MKMHGFPEVLLLMVIYFTVFTNWMFHCSVLCFLRRRPLHSVDHNLGEVLQLFRFPIFYPE